MQYPKPQSTPSDLYNPYQPPVTISTPVDFDFNQIQVEELFLDYSLGDLAIIRLGRQSATWGQGRLFNPGNLVQGIAGGMAVKVSTALGPVAFTAVGIKNDGLYRVDTANTLVALGIASVAAAGLADYSTDWFSSGVSGFYHVNVGGKGDAYFKTSFWGADLFVEGLGEAGIDGATSFSGVAGIYREFGDKSKWLKLQLEGLLSGRGNDGTFSTVVHHGNDFTDWTLGVAATTDALSFLSTRPSVLWLHSFADNSGQAVLGFVNSALPHLDLTFGLARVYGGSDSRYVTNNPDSVQKRTLLFTVKATFNFDIKG
jgi:hypothetical protein